MAKVKPTPREVALTLAGWLEKTAERIREDETLEALTANFNIQNEVAELPHDHPEVLEANAIIHYSTGRTTYEITFELLEPEVRAKAIDRKRAR